MAEANEKAGKLERLKNVEWKEPLGKGLRVTSKIVGAVSDFVPFAGIIKGATSMVADMLDPPVTLEQIRKLQENMIKLQNSGLSQIEEAKRVLGNEIEELKKLHNSPRPEVRTDFHNIKAEMLESFRAMQKENSVILSELTEMKEFVKKIFHLVVQISYKDGFETIDAAFETFISQTSLEDLQHFAFELQTTANKHFKVERIREYFTILKTHGGGASACNITAHYILIVLGKYLQMMTAYFIFKEDLEGLTNCHAKFNTTYSDLVKAFKEVTGEELEIGDSAVRESSRALKLNMAEDLKRIKLEPTSSSSHQQNLDGDVATFLARLNLSELKEIFENEEFDMEDVVNLSNEELKDIGVSKLKHRKLITQETQKLRRGSSRPAEPEPVKQIVKEPEVEYSREKPERMIVISSTGGAAQRVGGVLGQFEYDEDKRHYRQTSTDQGHEDFKAVYCYPYKDHEWWVGLTLGKKRGALHNPSPSNSLPTSGWQYGYDKSFHDDPTLTISPGPLSLARQFTVTATGAAAEKWPSCLGVFTRSERWWRGRPVYTNTRGRFLHHGGGDEGWMIGPTIGRRALRGSRAHHSPVSEESWRYWKVESGEWKPASVRVTGSD